jgi:hypothetical protein
MITINEIACCKYTTVPVAERERKVVLTKWRRIFFEKLIVTQLVKE